MKILPKWHNTGKGGIFMVKGISRQVIMVRPPEPKLFEQAIFILRDDAILDGITDEMLLREAKVAVASQRRNLFSRGPLWACGGALCTGIIWLLTALL
jgi:hypothetical protein